MFFENLSRQKKTLDRFWDYWNCNILRLLLRILSHESHTREGTLMCPLQFSYVFEIFIRVCNFNISSYCSYVDVCNSYSCLQFSYVFAILSIGSPYHADWNWWRCEWKYLPYYMQHKHAKTTKVRKRSTLKAWPAWNSFDIVFLCFAGPVRDPSHVVLCFCVFGALLLLVKLREGVITQVGNA